MEQLPARNEQLEGVRGSGVLHDRERRRAFRGPAGFDAKMGAVQSWKSMLAVSAAGGLTVLRVRDRRIVCQIGLRFILHRLGDWREQASMTL